MDTTTGLVPVRVEPTERSRDDWRRHHAYRRAFHLEAHPDDPYTPDDLAEARELKGHPFNIVESYEVTDGEAVVAGGTFVAAKPGAPAYESNKDFLHGWVGVLGSHRRRGIGRAFLHLYVDFARRHEGRVLSIWAEEESGHALAKRFGFNKTFEGHDNRLDLKGVDWAMVERWAADGPRRSPERRLELIEGRIPDDLLDQYCREVTELENLIPYEDHDHGDDIRTPERVRHFWEVSELAGDEIHTALVREPDGRITGVSELIVSGAHPEHTWQELTAVHPSVQGNGIGRWLKAAMLLHVRESHPERRWVLTGNAGSNAPMLKINHELGFRLHRAHAGYQVTADRLAEVLAER